MLNEENYDRESTRLRISVIERLLPALSYTIAGAGAGITGLLLIRVFETLRKSESAGIVAVKWGMGEANFAVLIALVISILVGFIGIIIAAALCFASRKTSSPPVWLMVIPAIFGLIPMGLIWYVETLIITIISPETRTPDQGIGSIASTITYVIFGAMIAAAVSGVVSLAASVIPFSSRPGRKFGTLIFLIIVEAALIAAAVAFGLRTDGLYRKGDSQSGLESAQPLSSKAFGYVSET